MHNLGPMEFGDIFNYTFRILRRKFLHLYLAMGWLYLPLGLFYNYYYHTALGESVFGPFGQAVPAFGFDTLLRSYLILFIYVFLQQALNPLTTAGAVQVVTRTLKEEETTAGDTFRAIFRDWTWLKLLALGAVVTVIMFMGALALLLPALFFAVAFSLVTPVVMVEGGGPWRALSRSWSIVLKDLGRVILVFLVMGLLAYFVTGVVTAPVALGMMVLMFLQVEQTFWYLALAMLSGFLNLLAAPVPVIAMTLLYHDLRTRREGIDLEQRIGAIP